MSVRLALALLLPLAFAVEVQPPAFGRALVASFYPGCQVLPPHTTVTMAGDQAYAPRPRDGAVTVHLAGSPPEGRYRVIATIDVLARTRGASLANLIAHAEREARKIGGQMLVDVTPSFAGDGGGDPRRIRLTAKIAIWS